MVGALMWVHLGAATLYMGHCSNTIRQTIQSIPITLLVMADGKIWPMGLPAFTQDKLDAASQEPQ